jgi:hypothetical protein
MLMAYEKPVKVGRINANDGKAADDFPGGKTGIDKNPGPVRLYEQGIPFAPAGKQADSHKSSVHRVQGRFFPSSGKPKFYTGKDAYIQG